MTVDRSPEEPAEIRENAQIEPTTEYSLIKVARCSEKQKDIISCLGLSGYINSES